MDGAVIPRRLSTLNCGPLYDQTFIQLIAYLPKTVLPFHSRKPWMSFQAPKDRTTLLIGSIQGYRARENCGRQTFHALDRPLYSISHYKRTSPTFSLSVYYFVCSNICPPAGLSICLPCTVTAQICVSSLYRVVRHVISPIYRHI